MNYVIPFFKVFGIGLLLTVSAIGCSGFPTWQTNKQGIPAPNLYPPGSIPDPGAPTGIQQAGFYETLAKMREQVKDAEDAQDVLKARSDMLNDQLRDKEVLLRQAYQEISKAQEALKKSDADVKRWKNELLLLRSQLESAETENVQNLKLIIRTLEQLLSQGAPSPSLPPGGSEPQNLRNYRPPYR